MPLLLTALISFAVVAVVLWAVSLVWSIRKDRLEAGIDEADIERELGEWLHEQLMDRYGLETEAWAMERVARVTKALNQARLPRPPVKAEILWMQEMMAFTSRGEYAYISRELLQRLSTDDAVALVIAHEMGHQDLGHTGLFDGRLNALRHVPHGALIAALPSLLTAQYYSLEREQAADVYALDLCASAGYDPDKCLELFDVLEAYAIDHGDVEGVFGPDPVDTGDHSLPGLISQAAAGLSKRLGGYPALRERRAALESD